MIREYLPLGSDESTDDEQSDETDDSPTVTAPTSERPLDTAATVHQSVLGPDDIERRPTATRTGDRWARTLWIGEFPDAPVDGIFQRLYSSAETRDADISLHIQPRDTHATLDSLENRIEDLEADVEYLSEKPTEGSLVLSGITAVGLGPATNNFVIFLFTPV